MKYFYRNIVKNEGMTMVELLLVITMIAVLAVFLIALINPTKQVQKAQDAKRQQEITQLSKTIGEFYNDKNHYPDDTQICYTSADVDGDTCSCMICGSESSSPSFSPYLSKLPCDPTHPSRDYLYQYQCSQTGWFKLYSRLSADSAYSYGVSSENTSLEPYPSAGAPPPTRVPLPLPGPGGGNNCVNPTYCLRSGFCNICGSPSACLNPATCDPGQYFTNSSCSNSCTIR
ncbi:MAG: type IV pilin protein [Candidatus Roizmanbacteria bacterium]